MNISQEMDKLKYFRGPQDVLRARWLNNIIAKLSFEHMHRHFSRKKRLSILLIYMFFKFHKILRILSFNDTWIWCHVCKAAFNAKSIDLYRKTTCPFDWDIYIQCNCVFLFVNQFKCVMFREDFPFRVWLHSLFIYEKWSGIFKYNTTPSGKGCRFSLRVLGIDLWHWWCINAGSHYGGAPQRSTQVRAPQGIEDYACGARLQSTLGVHPWDDRPG